jgi:hypothetical protein
MYISGIGFVENTQIVREYTARGGAGGDTKRQDCDGNGREGGLRITLGWTFRYAAGQVLILSDKPALLIARLHLSAARCAFRRVNAACLLAYD